MRLFERWYKKEYDGGKSVKLVTYLNSFFGWENKIDELKQGNAYQLSLELAEVFLPIDAIANRVSSLFYEIQDLEGNLIALTDLQKKLLKSPNPLTARFSDLIYSIAFSELADGNAYTYCNSLGLMSPGYISSIWSLNPSLVTINYKTSAPDLLSITSKSDLVSSYSVSTGKGTLDPKSVIHTTSSFLQTNNCNGLLEGRSPLMAAKRNIDNLLLVYQARYKVYKNNGMAGILSRASSPANGSVEAAIDPITRDNIISDLNNEYGLTGDKKFNAVTSVPLQFIKTLATISELRPFDEAEADAITIAGIYGVDKELIPKRGSTTFTNKKDAEIALWQNTVKPIADDICRILDDAFMLPPNHKFVAKSDHIEVLQEDASIRLETDTKKIDNIIKIKSSAYENDPLMQKILKDYE